MNEIKTSTLLTQLIETSKGIGDKRNPPFTAERFLVAIIDKMNSSDNEKDNDELLAVGELVKKFVGDLNAAKESLMAYICQEKSTSFLDDLYMKKKLQEASCLASKANVPEVDAFALVLCITQDPSQAIKSVLKVDAAKEEAETDSDDVSDEDLTAALEAKFDELFGKIDSDTEEDENNSDDSQEIKSASSVEKKTAPKSVKADMSSLVTDVKRIRAELQNSVYGQDNAINVFATGYFQANMLSMIDKSRKRPRATFLFAGPPGVGKTFLAEKAAEALKLPFMRFDMSEYADKEANLEFCGSDKVYKNAKAGNVTSFVADNPKCVLLFDEIEKAHLCVIHLFLQMLDAGRLRDNYTDKEVSFSDAIIILTTNAGKQLYEESESGDFSAVSRKVIVKALQKDINPETGAPFFPGAICSRFASGNVVMFNHIGAHNLRSIAKKEIERHASNLEKETGIKLQIDDRVYTALLFSEGSAADARTIRSRAETFFNDELYELLRLIASDKVKTSIDINSDKSGRYYVDVATAYGTVADYYRRNISKQYIPEDEIVTVDDYLKNYIQSNIIDVYSKLSRWNDIESFLLEEDTPLYPYWKCINTFPVHWEMDHLLEALWINDDCIRFFNMMQRFGERKYVFEVLEMFKQKYGISAFHQELFESYVDVVHLGGGYREAVQLYNEYLEPYSYDEIIDNPTLLHYCIRRIHHSMFFAPVKELIGKALELISHMDSEKTPKDYNEILFLLGGNLGVLSGDFAFASEWLNKAGEFAIKIGDNDFQKRAARKQVDLLCLKGNFEGAMTLVEKFTSLDKEAKSRYEVYLLGALGETYRQIGDLENAKRAFKKLLDLTKLKGLTGWECHAYLGLANLECESKAPNIDKINRYLESANAIYQRSGLVWGIVNSGIVRFRAYKKVDCVTEDYLIELMKTKDLATRVEYAYEANILDDLLVGKTVDNYRLLFL